MNRTIIILKGMRFVNIAWIAVLVAGSCERDPGIGMKTLDFGQFTIEVPGSWNSVAKTGYDSFVGGIRINDNTELNFDLGLYSSKLDVDPGSHEITWTTIDGRKAKLVRSQVAGEGTTGVYFDSLESGALVKFQMNAQHVNPAIQQQLMTAFSTINFKSLNELPTNAPECLSDVISEIESEPVRNPPASLWRYEYDGQIVYYIPQYCCDFPSTLLDSDCEFICSPDGGFSGQGDGKCTGTLANGTQIWQDIR